MQIDRRFADYGLTGGFFLICQLGLLWALGYWPRILGELQALQLPPDKSLLAPIITGFAGAFAVIAVFVAGLILDLLASLFRTIEMRVFSRHLDRNSDWINTLIEAHKTYCGSDCETFQRAMHELPSPWKLGIDTGAFTLWKRESRRRYLTALKVNFGLGIAREYERLSSFFTSYIMVQAGSSAHLTLMADQYSLWRTARAIATAIYVFIFELFLLPSVSFFLLGKDLFAAFPENLVVAYFVVFVPLFIGVGLIFYIIHGTYSRLCFTLFSLVYVAYDKQIESTKDVEPSP
jgi:hypothetical protein